MSTHRRELAMAIGSVRAASPGAWPDKCDCGERMEFAFDTHGEAHRRCVCGAVARLKGGKIYLTRPQQRGKKL